MAMASSSASLAFLSSSIFNGSPKGRAQAVPCKTLRATRVARPCQGVRAELATLPVLSFSGEKVGEAALDLRSAPPETARAVVHRGLVTHLQNKRRGTASTLTRAEVRGGGRKPYPQKKTGGACRGSQRTPLRPGGGVIFGPQPKDWTIKMNRKEKRLALSTAIANATSAAFVLEDFGNAFDKSPKTKEFVEALKRWGLDPAEKVTVLATEVPENVFLSCRNIGTVKVLTPRTLNLYDVLDAKNLIFTRSALEYLNSVYGEDSDFVEDEEEDEEGQGEEEDGDVNGS